MTDRKPQPHELVPEHRLLGKDDAEKIVAKYNVSKLQLPKIGMKDAALVGMGAKEGQVVGITRLDGSQYFRLVIKD